MDSYTVTFIGGGRMASALIAGLIESGVSPNRIHVVDPNPEVSGRLHERWGVVTAGACDSSATEADMLVLAVKPQAMREATAGIALHLNSTHTPMVLSVASGVSLGDLEAMLGERPMVRAMPNTPAMMGVGMTAMVANPHLQERHRAWAFDLMSRVGECVWLDDEQTLDLVTALSGSGPAYFFALAEHMIQAATVRGMSPELAKTLVHQTAMGAGQLLAQAGADARDLRTQVTSPGGTTEAALAVFDQHQFSKLIDQAIEAAMQRSKALGQTNRSQSKENS